MENINELYLDLLAKSLTNTIHEDKIKYLPIWNFQHFNVKLISFLNKILRNKNLSIVKISTLEDAKLGKVTPYEAETMVGLLRLNNIKNCIENILKENIKGDFIETGVWRGGSVIFMQAILKINNIVDRLIWCADSFEGLPVPNQKLYPDDGNDEHYKINELAVSLEEVKFNFKKYNLLDDNIIFLKGWFKDTLPNATIDKIALLRLDGDLYESTMEALDNLYPKVVIGGYIIVDDYGGVITCKKAIDDFRIKMNINEEIIKIDWTGVFWRKTQ